MNILVNMHLHPDQITQLEALPDVHLIDRDEFTPAMGSTIDVILAWNPTAAAIMSAPNHVRFIQTMSAGVDYLHWPTLRAKTYWLLTPAASTVSQLRNPCSVISSTYAGP